MAQKEQLVTLKYEGGKFNFIPADPEHFRVGLVKRIGDNIILYGGSQTFPSYVVDEKELETMLTNASFM